MTTYRYSKISIEYASDSGRIPKSAINFESIIASLSDAKSSVKDIIVLSVYSVNFVTHPASCFSILDACQAKFGKKERWLEFILFTILLNRRKVRLIKLYVFYVDIY